MHRTVVWQCGQLWSFGPYWSSRCFQKPNDKDSFWSLGPDGAGDRCTNLTCIKGDLFFFLKNHWMILQMLHLDMFKNSKSKDTGGWWVVVSAHRGTSWTLPSHVATTGHLWFQTLLPQFLGFFGSLPDQLASCFGCNASVIQWLDTSCTSFLLASFGCIGTWAGLSSPMTFLPAPSFLPPAPYRSLRSCCVALRSQECCRKPVRCKIEDMGYLGDAPQPLLPFIQVGFFPRM